VRAVSSKIEPLGTIINAEPVSRFTYQTLASRPILTPAYNEPAADATRKAVRIRADGVQARMMKPSV